MSLALGNNRHIVISSTLHQVQDSEGFRNFGINFDSLDIMVVKSRIHFRAFYEDVAAEIIEVDAKQYILLNHSREPGESENVIRMSDS